MDAESPYLIADQTVLSNKEARAYVAWRSHGDAERVADDLDVSESTAWSYKYRVNDKLDRAARTVSLRKDGEPMTDPDTVLEHTFFNRGVRGNDRGASRDHAVTMAEAQMMNLAGAALDDVADLLEIDEQEADRLLGEAEVIIRQSQKTIDKLGKLGGTDNDDEEEWPVQNGVVRQVNEIEDDFTGETRYEVAEIKVTRGDWKSRARIAVWMDEDLAREYAETVENVNVTWDWDEWEHTTDEDLTDEQRAILNFETVDTDTPSSRIIGETDSGRVKAFMFGLGAEQIEHKAVVDGEIVGSYAGEDEVLAALGELEEELEKGGDE